MAVTILDAYITASTPQYVCLTYRSDTSIPPASDATALIELELLAPSPDYLNVPPRILNARAYAIDLALFSVNCESTEYDVRLFTKNQLDLADTAYEDLVYTAVDKSINDIFERFIIKNDDDPPINKLYILIQNFSSVATGPIDIELTYIPIEDC